MVDSSTNVTFRKLQTEPYLEPVQKSSLIVKDLNKNPNTLNLIGEKLGDSRELIDTRKDFLNRILLAMTSRSSANEWDFIKMKIFHVAKDSFLWTMHQIV